MKRYFIVGLLVFLGFAIRLAPADILDRLLTTNTPAKLIRTQGTLWQGHGELLFAQTNIGKVTWHFQPSALFRAIAKYSWTLNQSEWQLAGIAGVTFSHVQFEVDGNVTQDMLNRFLQPYDIDLQGGIEISPTRLTIELETERVQELEGQIDWQGGRVRYTLSGLLRETILPPMTGYLSINDNGQPQAIVYAQNQQTPLIIASLEANGYAKIGITKLFTKLLNNPWPGSDPDHTIVLQVEEKII